MKVAVTASGPSMDSAVDPRFGRCAYFVFVETNDDTSSSVENTNAALSGGAGPQAARLMAEHGVKAVLTGECGPNAHQALHAAGIDAIVGCHGTVAEAVARFRAGDVRVAEGPTVASHNGLPGGHR